MEGRRGRRGPETPCWLDFLAMCCFSKQFPVLARLEGPAPPCPGKRLWPPSRGPLAGGSSVATGSWRVCGSFSPDV